MNGLAIKKILQMNNISQTSVAEKLGITTQALSTILKAQDVKSGFLGKLSEATGIPITEFYGQPPMATNIANGSHNTQAADNATIINEGGGAVVALTKEIEEQRKLTAQALEQSSKALDQNSRLISVLEAVTKKQSN